MVVVVFLAAILFWLNCKSVYSYWQNERKLLNVEVREHSDVSTQVKVQLLADQESYRCFHAEDSSAQSLPDSFH